MNSLAPIALWGFWMLLAGGWIFGELRVKGVTIFLLLWVAGYVGSRFVLDGALFTSYVAVLDIALVLTIVKSDIRLT